MYKFFKSIIFFIIVFIFFNNWQAFSSVNFFFGPKVSLCGNDTNDPDSFFFQKNTKIKTKNYAKGNIYTFGIFGGINYKIPFFVIALQSEINYLYSYKLVSAWIVSDIKNQKYPYKNISSIDLHYFSFPLFLKFTLPLLKIFTGPRIRIYESLLEKKYQADDFENLKKHYNKLYIDWCSRFCIGLNKWGVEIGIGVEISKILYPKISNLNIIYKNTIYTWYTYMGFDIIRIINLNNEI